MSLPPELDPARFGVHTAPVRGLRLAYTHEGRGPGRGSPLLLVHGWPETRRIWWRNVAALVAAGFEVVAPDLRGFGESEVAPDGFGDVASHSLDLYALTREQLEHSRVSVVGGDAGAAIAQDLSLRFPGFVDRLVVFNGPLPFLPDAMAGLRTRPAKERLDYYVRQGRDADALAAELASPEARRAYVEPFYADGRAWAHAGAFSPEAVAFHAAPFGDAAKLRAGFRLYESVFDPDARRAPALLARNPTPTAILFGTSDRVVAPDFDAMARRVFPNHRGPVRVPGAGHFLQWEAPTRLERMVRAHCAPSERPPDAATRAFVSLGANLGPREATLCGAIAALRATPGVQDVVASRTYETDPVGPGAQDDYLNLAVRLDTTLAPRALLERLQAIERDHGRVRGERNAARTLDLDLLFYGTTRLDEPGLVVPHPRIAERPFVLEPLCDLDPDFVHPVARASLAALAERVRDPRAVRLRGLD